MSLKPNPLRKLDEIVVDEHLKQETMQFVYDRKKRSKLSFPKLALSVSVCIVMVIGMFSILNQPTYAKEYSFITIDINPSLQLVLDKEDNVIKIDTYDPIAKKIVEQLSYEGKPYDEVVTQLILHEEYKALIQEDSFLQISVYSKNENKGLQLKQGMSQCVQRNSEVPFQSECVNEETHQKASSHHMSSGRYKMIEEIQKIDEKQTMSYLETLSMQQLRTLYASLTGEEVGRGQRHGRNH